MRVVRFISQPPVIESATEMFRGRQKTTVKGTCPSWPRRAKKEISYLDHNANFGDILRYGLGEAPDKEGTVKHAAFTLEGQEFAAMDSAHPHDFTFNEAISFEVRCETQKEIDYYWGKLSADPTAEQCGWLKDKFGLSWQIVPAILDEMLKDKDKKKIARVTEAFLKMKKFDIALLKRAYEGR